MLHSPSLLEYNAQGLIPGPGETESEFLKRVDYCLRLKEFIPDSLEKVPLSTDAHAAENVLRDASKTLLPLYDIAPLWIPLYFSNYRLAPWHGGCAWIFQMDRDSPTAALFQLRKAFLHSVRYLGLYDRNEIVTHELCHVGRMMFEEPKFEEHLAYHTSPSRFRRWFGALVQSSYESMVFVLAILITLLFDISLLFLQPTETIALSLWAKLLPISLILFALCRLVLRHFQIRRCLAKLHLLAKTTQQAEAILYRMTDKEILSFGTMTLDEIKSYVSQDKSLRWRVIAEAYVPHLRLC